MVSVSTFAALGWRVAGGRFGNPKQFGWSARTCMCVRCLFPRAELKLTMTPFLYFVLDF